MSIEEKAKAYDKALDRMKHVVIVPKNEKALQALKETIFPELRESDDERIIREMLEYFTITRQSDFCSRPDRQAWIAWLEKQKEPNHIPWYDLQKSKEAGYTILKTEEYEELIKQKEHQELPLMNGDADLYFDTWRQEVQVPTFRQCFEEGMRYAQRLQKEQKPVEYGDDIVEDAEEYTSKVDCGEYGVEVTEAHIAGALRERSKKPVEWTERHIADVFEKVGLAKIVREQGNDNLTNALQSAMIELASPVEWSEEDENNIGWLVAFLQGEEGSGEVIELMKESLISWLKSLRPQPHWKPSEEQMTMLRAVLNDPNNAGAESCQLALSGLYEQLKKLM